MVWWCGCASASAAIEIFIDLLYESGTDFDKTKRKYMCLVQFVSTKLVLQLLFSNEFSLLAFHDGNDMTGHAFSKCNKTVMI